MSSHPQARSRWWLNGSIFSTSHSHLFPSFLFHFLSLSWAKWKHSGRFSTSHSHLFLSLFHFFLFLFYFLSLSHMSSIVLVFNGKCGRFFIQSNPIQVLQSTSTSDSVLYRSLLNVRKEDSNWCYCQLKWKCLTLISLLWPFSQFVTEAHWWPWPAPRVIIAINNRSKIHLSTIRQIREWKP